MAKILSLYDAIIKTKVSEDQCTYFLFWLLEKLPIESFYQISKKAELQIDDKIDLFSFESQYPLENSRPDVLIKYSGDKYLVVEVKRFPNCFDKEQFLNHLNGSFKEFGKEKVSLLFLSGDDLIPDELIKIQKKYPQKIGFLSWKTILKYFHDIRYSTDEKYKIIIEEFLTFSKHYGLGRLIKMSNDDLNKFIDIYCIYAKYEKSAQEIINELCDKIIETLKNNFPEVIEDGDPGNDYDYKSLPCISREIKIKSWHTVHSGYVFINIIDRKIGIILSGYQGEEEKEMFLPLWKETLQDKYLSDSNLISFTYTYENDDECSINGGYFQPIKSTIAKKFNPDDFSEFEYDFYWGFLEELEVNNFSSLPDIISDKFRQLQKIFLAK